MRHPFSPLFALPFLLLACGGGAASAPKPDSPAPALPPASSAAAASGPLAPDAIAALVAAPDRTDDDRKQDAKRHPAEFLAFAGVGPGMSVADIGAGGGYTTELLARAVGPSGKVYGQNDPDLLKRFIEKFWAPRLARPAMKNVVRTDRPFDDPLPPEARDIDLIVDFIFYQTPSGSASTATR